MSLRLRRMLVTLEDGPDLCLAGGMAGGDLQGLAVRPAEERADDVGVDDTWECVALLGEVPDVVTQGLTGLLLAVLVIPRITRTHVRALKVADEHFPEVCPATDGVGGKNSS